MMIDDATGARGPIAARAGDVSGELGMSVDSLVSPGETALLAAGTVVEVMARCWPGSNKPGGVARVVRSYFDPEDGGVCYDVAYIVNNGKENSIEERYVKLHATETGRRRTHGRCKFCGSFVRDCAHDQSMSDAQYAGSRAVPVDPTPFTAASVESTSATLVPLSSAPVAGRRKRKKRRSTATSVKRTSLSELQYDDIMVRLSSTGVAWAPDDCRPDQGQSEANMQQQQQQHQRESSPQPLLSPRSPRQELQRLDADAASSSAPELLDMLYVLQSMRQPSSSRDHWVYQQARAFHRDLFDCCLLEGDGRSSGVAGLGAQFRAHLRSLPQLTVPVLWELMLIAHNFVVNMQTRSASVYPEARRHLRAQCHAVHLQFPSHLRHGDSAFVKVRYDLATALVSEDDAEETSYKRIERVGFDLFYKCQQRLQAAVKTTFAAAAVAGGGAVTVAAACPAYRALFDELRLGALALDVVRDDPGWRRTRRAIKSRLEQYETFIDSISISFGDIMKTAKTEMKEIGDIFAECFEFSAEDVVDDLADEEEVGDSDDGSADDGEVPDEDEADSDFVASEEGRGEAAPTPEPQRKQRRERDQYQSALSRRRRDGSASEEELEVSLAHRASDPRSAAAATHRDERDRHRQPAPWRRVAGRAGISQDPASVSDEDKVQEEEEKNEEEDMSLRAFLDRSSRRRPWDRAPKLSRHRDATFAPPQHDHSGPSEESRGLSERSFRQYYRYLCLRHRDQPREERAALERPETDGAALNAEARRQRAWRGAVPRITLNGVVFTSDPRVERSVAPSAVPAQAPSTQAARRRERDSWNLAIRAEDYHAVVRAEERFADLLLSSAIADLHEPTGQPDWFAALLASDSVVLAPEAEAPDSLSAPVQEALLDFFASLWDQAIAAFRNLDAGEAQHKAYHSLHAEAQAAVRRLFLQSVYQSMEQVLDQALGPVLSLRAHRQEVGRRAFSRSASSAEATAEGRRDLAQLAAALTASVHSVRTVLFSPLLFRFYASKLPAHCGEDLATSQAAAADYFGHLLTLTHRLEGHLANSLAGEEGLVAFVFADHACPCLELAAGALGEYLLAKLAFCPFVLLALSAGGSDGVVGPGGPDRVLRALYQALLEHLRDVLGQLLLGSPSKLYGIACTLLRAEEMPDATACAPTGRARRFVQQCALLLRALRWVDELSQRLAAIARKGPIAAGSAQWPLLKPWERTWLLCLEVLVEGREAASARAWATTKLTSLLYADAPPQDSAVQLACPTLGLTLAPSSQPLPLQVSQAERLWALIPILHAFQRGAPGPGPGGRAPNGWLFVRQLVALAGESLLGRLQAHGPGARIDAWAAYRALVQDYYRVARLAALWDNSYEAYSIVVQSLVFTRPLLAMLPAQRSEGATLSAVRPLDVKTMVVASHLSSQKPASGDLSSDDAAQRGQLHLRLLRWVARLTRRSGLANPYQRYLAAMLGADDESPEPDAETSPWPPLGGIDDIRQALQELLAGAVLDHTAEGLSKASAPLVRKLRVSIDQSLGSTTGLTALVGTRGCSYPHCVLYLQLLKELAAHADDVRQQSAQVMDRLIQTPLLECEAPGCGPAPARLLSDCDAYSVRTVLLFHAALVVFNPLPVPANTGTGPGSAPGLRGGPRLLVLEDFARNCEAFWLADARDAASLEPFASLLRLLVHVHRDPAALPYRAAVVESIAVAAMSAHEIVCHLRHRLPHAEAEMAGETVDGDQLLFAHWRLPRVPSALLGQYVPLLQLLLSLGAADQRVSADAAGPGAGPGAGRDWLALAAQNAGEVVAYLHSLMTRVVLPLRALLHSYLARRGHSSQALEQLAPQIAYLRETAQQAQVLAQALLAAEGQSLRAALTRLLRSLDDGTAAFHAPLPRLVSCSPRQVHTAGSPERALYAQLVAREAGGRLAKQTGQLVGVLAMATALAEQAGPGPGPAAEESVAAAMQSTVHMGVHGALVAQRRDACASVYLGAALHGQTLALALHLHALGTGPGMGDPTLAGLANLVRDHMLASVARQLVATALGALMLLPLHPHRRDLREFLDAAFDWAAIHSPQSQPQPQPQSRQAQALGESSALAALLRAVRPANGTGFPCSAVLLGALVQSMAAQPQVAQHWEALVAAAMQTYFRGLRHLQLGCFQSGLADQRDAYALELLAYGVICAETRRIGRAMEAPGCSLTVTNEFLEEFLRPLAQAALLPEALRSRTAPRSAQLLTVGLHFRVLLHVPFATRCLDWEVLLAFVLLRPCGVVMQGLWATLLTLTEAQVADAAFVRRAQEEAALCMSLGYLSPEESGSIIQALELCHELHTALPPTSTPSTASPHPLRDYLLGTQSDAAWGRVAAQAQELVLVQEKAGVADWGTDQGAVIQVAEALATVRWHAVTLGELLGSMCA